MYEIRLRHRVCWPDGLRLAPGQRLRAHWSGSAWRTLIGRVIPVMAVDEYRPVRLGEYHHGKIQDR